MNPVVASCGPLATASTDATEKLQNRNVPKSKCKQTEPYPNYNIRKSKYTPSQNVLKSKHTQIKNIYPN